MRPCAVALALVTLLLAGCAVPNNEGGPAPSMTNRSPRPTQAPGPSASPGIEPLPPSPTLALEQCTNVGGIFPVPADAAQAALPPGFKVDTSVDPAGGATLYVLAVRCGKTTVTGNATGATQLVYAELAVTPGGAQAVEGIADSTMPLVAISDRAEVGALLEHWGWGIAGAGTIERTELAAGAGQPATVQVVGSLGGVRITLAATLAPTGSSPLGSGAFAVYGVRDGKVVATTLGESRSGDATTAGAVLQAKGHDLLAQARPAAKGFSVAGYDLMFRSA